MRVINYDLRKQPGLEGVPALVKESSHYYPIVEKIRDGSDVWKLMSDVYYMGGALEEYVYALAFDNAMHLLGVFLISKGTQEASLFGTKEIISRLLMIRANNTILCHNHPSGDLTPSREDISATEKLRDACKLMDITLQDHLIISEDGYCSMRETNIVKF